MCSQFPLHHFVFAQTASHMCHEANCESFFSLVKKISDPNMFPTMLCNLSKIAASQWHPSTEDIQERYWKKFGKSNDAEDEDDLDFEPASLYN